MVSIELASEKCERAVTATFSFIECKISQVQNSKVGRLYSRPRKAKKYVRPIHDLMCECRKCIPSINTYHRKLQELE